MNNNVIAGTTKTVVLIIVDKNMTMEKLLHKIIDQYMFHSFSQIQNLHDINGTTKVSILESSNETITIVTSISI